MQYKTPRQLFAEKHGTNCVLDGNWFLFPDGARAENSDYGALREPPENPFEQADLLVRYYEVRLAHAKAAFDDRQKHWENVLNAIAKGDIHDTYMMEEEMAKLRRPILLIQDHMQEAIAHRDSLPMPDAHKRQRSRQAELNQAQQTATKLREKLSRLRV
jgi:hypothetical protein